MNLETGYTQLLIEKCKKHKLLRNQAAYVLATVYHETAHSMEPVEEGYYLGKDKARRHQKTLRYYPWFGRGFVQLTWEPNYLKASKKLGVDFIADPTKAMDPELSAEICVLGMKEGWFTGRKLRQTITLFKSGFVKSRGIVNGKDKAHAIAAYARAYDALLEEAGYGVVNPKPLSKSRINKGAVATGGGGVIVLVEPVEKVVDVVKDNQDKLSSGDWVQLAIGLVIVAGALYTLYARWDDAGKPLPWKK